MSKVKLYIARHGKTMFNTIGRVQGWSDSPLTPFGEEGIRELGVGLKAAGIPFKSAYSSDSGRTIQTMDIILRETGLETIPYKRDKRIREWCFGSFDGGYGSGYLARTIGHKKAKEVWFMTKQYTAEEALAMNWINTVVPLDRVEDETMEWAETMLQKSPLALRMIKASMNADTDGLAGIQQLAGDATLLYYTMDEAKEGRDAFKEKRQPNFDQFPKFP